MKRRPVSIVREGGSTRKLFLDCTRGGVIYLTPSEEGGGGFRYEFALTGEALSRELQVEIEGEASKGRRIGDPRQQMFGEPSVYQVTRRTSRWVAIWRIDPADLEWIKGGG